MKYLKKEVKRAKGIEVVTIRINQEYENQLINEMESKGYTVTDHYVKPNNSDRGYCIEVVFKK